MNMKALTAAFLCALCIPSLLPANSSQSVSQSSSQPSAQSEYVSILQTHVRFFEELDHWQFSKLPNFFVPADVEKNTPLVFITDGWHGHHESWRGVDPMKLIERWALTTGNKTRLEKVQIEETPDSLGYATFDMERDCPLVTGETRTYHYRVTTVLRYSKEKGWRILHLHLSQAGMKESGKWDVDVEGPREDPEVSPESGPEDESQDETEDDQDS